MQLYSNFFKKESWSRHKSRTQTWMGGGSQNSLVSTSSYLPSSFNKPADTSGMVMKLHCQRSSKACHSHWPTAHSHLSLVLQTSLTPYTYTQTDTHTQTHRHTHTHTHTTAALANDANSLKQLTGLGSTELAFPFRMIPSLCEPLLVFMELETTHNYLHHSPRL